MTPSSTSIGTITPLINGKQVNSLMKRLAIAGALPALVLGVRSDPV